ncbi:hypothetical protein BSKO_06869 [Bryopsis sp. KO-2023]|nr:hypothetical protein BSKO_06869 [Bryopsis sp. KO-2023]
MQTYSHFLITALICDLLGRRTPPIKTGKAFLWGSVAPDIPLIGLTIGYALSNKISGSNASTFGDAYDELYFHNPLWIVLTSLFHAPFLILFYAGLGAALNKRKSLGRLSKAGKPLCWFAAGCALHSLLDIPTHAGDGPALLFPFEWHARFNSPVSYWDPDHHGDIFAPIEAALDFLLIVYFLVRCIQSRKNRRRIIDTMTSVEVSPITERKSHRSGAGGSVDQL